MKKKICFLNLILAFVFCMQDVLFSSPSDQSWQYLGTSGFSSGYITSIKICTAPDGTIYVGYQDITNTYKASVMKYDGSAWVYCGVPEFTPDKAYTPCLGIGPDNLPNIAFLDGASKRNGHVSVMKFNGSDWGFVGPQGFSAGVGIFSVLTFSPTGIPYMAYNDLEPGVFSECTVMKFNGTTWDVVGIPGFSPAVYRSVALSFDFAGHPIVLFQDNTSYENRLTLMKYNGTTWLPYGTSGPSTFGFSEPISFAINNTDEVFVPFPDYDNGRKLSVMKMNGTTWEYVGVPGISNGPVDAYDISCNRSGDPYIAFIDSSLSHKLTVMKFDGTNWVYVGSPGFSSDYSFIPSITFTNSDNPVVAFQDGETGRLSVMKYDYPAGNIEKKKENISIYPNPASTFITLQLPETGRSERIICIYDATGSVLQELKTVENTLRMQVNVYPAGLYLIRVTSENSAWTGRFCKL